MRNGHPLPSAPTDRTVARFGNSPPGDNRTNDTTPTITGAGGITGDTITLSANGTVVGSGTVANGTWAVTTSGLIDGAYSLTATQTDAAQNVSLSSQPLLVTIDTSLPVTTPVSLTVQPNSGPALIGITLPTDPDDNFSDPNQAPTIAVFSLPSNGIVTLGGVTPVSVGQQLTTSQLTGLDFTPTGQTGTTGTFTYAVTDLAGNPGTGAATFTIAAPPPPPPPPPPPLLTVQKFDFLFTYNDGKDYYIGTVTDDGRFGYHNGYVQTTIAGQYQIFAVEPNLASEAPGTVSVSIYSHGGVGQASPNPIKTSKGCPTASTGWPVNRSTPRCRRRSARVQRPRRSVVQDDPVLGLRLHVCRWQGLLYRHGCIGNCIYSWPFNVTDASGNLVGSYSVFKQGQTTRTDSTVVVDGSR